MEKKEFFFKGVGYWFSNGKYLLNFKQVGVKYKYNYRTKMWMRQYSEMLLKENKRWKNK